MLTVYKLVTAMGGSAEITEYRPSQDIAEDWKVKGYNIEVVREELEDNDELH